MRKALVVGINAYEYASNLKGCVNDAERIHALLDRNEDHSKNFHSELKKAETHDKPINRRDLKRCR